MPQMLMPVTLLVLMTLVSSEVRAQSTPRGSSESDGSLVKMASQVVGEGGTVCDATWMTDASGTRTIIAIVDYTGRRFCNEVLRIRPQPQPVIIQKLRAWNPEKADDLLRDLDGDGKPELVLYNLLTPYNGSRCVAVAPFVYKCSQSHCSEATRQFREFLIDQMALLKEPREDATAPEYEDEMSCYIVQRDALQRLSGIDPKAGMETARQWLASQKPDLRRKGLQVLLNIDDEEAREVVRGLVNDRDKAISGAAALAVRDYAERQP